MLLAAACSDDDATTASTTTTTDVAAAEAAGYEAFLDCFDDPAAGGQGQYYVNMDLPTGTVESAAPEAMVYEATPDGLELAGVEYIVPGDVSILDSPPELFGETFHLSEVLGSGWCCVACLVWEDNPSGDFGDWNPTVRLCG